MFFSTVAITSTFIWSNKLDFLIYSEWNKKKTALERFGPQIEVMVHLLT